MTYDPREDHDELAERTTRLLAHLDGVLDASMLNAMQGAWSMLEHASTDAPAHARAVRARMLWESMDPGAAASAALVGELVPTWSDEDEPDMPVAGEDDPDFEVVEAA